MPHEDTSLEDLLRRRARLEPPGPEARPLGGQLCGDAEALAAYAEGALPKASRERFEAHLAACGACQTAVVRLMRLAPEESAAAAGRRPAPTPAVAGGFRWRWAIPALAGVVLVGSFVYYEREKIGAPPEPVAQSASQQKATEPAPRRADAREETESPAGLKAGRDLKNQPAAVEKDQAREQQAPRQRVPGGGIQQQQPSPSFAPAPPPPPAAKPAEPQFAKAPPVEFRKEAAEAAPPAQPPAGARPEGKPAKVEPAPAAAAPGTESAAKRQSAMGQTERYAQREAATEEKAAQEKSKTAADQVAVQPERPRAAGAGAGIGSGAGGALAPGVAAGRMNIEVRRADAARDFQKLLEVGPRRFALNFSNQLVAAGQRSDEWQAIRVPSGQPVIDFAISGKHLWVLLPGGRVGLSPDLGRTWEPPVETGAEDAVSILFTSARNGEIRTRSGERLRTTDGGETWHK